jgi:preprotein translocase subunit SecA
MLTKIAKVFGYDPQKKEIGEAAELARQITLFEPEFEKLTDAELFQKSTEFKQRYNDGETLDDLMLEAYATVREVSKRTLGLRHFDVQMVGGIAMHRGKIAEMRTGEGKTLVATLPVYLNAITGQGVHVVTVNDYLARRDARWMSPIYVSLGLSVGVLQMASRTENGQKAFIVDLEKTSSFEDQDQLVMVNRQQAYLSDVVYGTNSEFGFDYLRDNLTNRLSERVQRGHYYAIIDEIDNILIDEARTPLIISGPASDETEWYNRMAIVVRQLNPEDYEISEKDRYVNLTELGEAHVEDLLQMPIRDPERPEDISPEQARLLGYLEQALKAQHLFRKNKDYLVQGGKVVIVDEFTGRLMPGRRWSEGLHQAVEAKEGVKVEPENVTYATITIQNYFRMYEKLAGMTGTAETESEEFHKIYSLEVLPIPTNLEYQAFGKDSPMITVEDKDEGGYRYTYYASRDDVNKTPIFYKRKDFPDIVYRTEEAKLRAIGKEVLFYHVLGRPQLIGTTSVELSDRLSDRLSAESVRRLLQTLLIRDAWMRKNNRDMIEQKVPELEFLNESIDQLNISQLRKFAREIGLESINLQDPDNIKRLLNILDLPDESEGRLNDVLQTGVSHRVLNARKHDEEALIINKAGAFGAVTIATNMAGRGVDIKLGGEISEEIHADIARVLRKNQVDPYTLRDEDKRQILKKMNAEQYGIYADSVNSFLQSIDEMESVRSLGGLHVIGSERHEARRIDNQLRGRAARQGDPGSSRFYLSLEDELMRLFGGQQVDGLMRRFNVDANIPIESGIVGRLVEQSQQRVEGSNFDVRKHLLEYDDVLNTQRKRIYSQRDRVFTKEDLTEDVMEMVRMDVEQRVSQAMIDEEGPWKLVAYLADIQPSIDYETVFYPAFHLRILVDEYGKSLGEFPISKDKVKPFLLRISEDSLNSEINHAISSSQKFLVRVEESITTQKLERLDALDSFLAGLEESQEVEPKKPQQILQEITNLVRTPIQLNQQQIQDLIEGSQEIEDEIQDQVIKSLLIVNVNRAVATFAIRFANMEVKPGDYQGKDWDETVDLLLDAVDDAFARQKTSLLGDQGQLSIEIDNWLKQIDSEEISKEDLFRLMIALLQGSRLAFDRKTHRQVRQRYNRLNYIYLAALAVQKIDTDQVNQMVLIHLQEALSSLKSVWGIYEINRLQQNQVSLANLDEKSKNLLSREIGDQEFETLKDIQIPDLQPEKNEIIRDVLGKRVRNEIYRELLLSIISQMWVEYLTKVEALRVSIGLEAYGQRDPLVQYKSQASELFKALLVDIRSALVNRMFTYRPSQGVNTTIEKDRTIEPVANKVADDQETDKTKKKRKRRRH